MAKAIDTKNRYYTVNNLGVGKWYIFNCHLLHFLLAKNKASAKEITFVDITAPTVKSAVIEGNNKIVVEFSEPVDKNTVDTSVFKLDGYDLSAFGFTGPIAWEDTAEIAKNTKLTLNFGLALPTGAHVLDVKGGKIKDVAGFFVETVKFNLSVVDDTTAPVFVSATAVDLNTLDITFDEAVEKPALNAIKVNGTALPVAATVDYKPATTDKKTIRISNAGLAKGVNLVEITKEGVADVYGNKTKEAIRFSVEAAADTVKPQVKNVISTDDKTIKIVFTEAMAINATNKANYTIKNAAGVKVGTINSVTPVENEDFAYNINLASALPGGVYTVEIANVQDTSENVIDTVSKQVTVKDTTPPTVDDVTLIDATEKVIKVTFSEPMDRDSISAKSNYQVSVDGTAFQKIDDAKLTVADDNKSVTIDLPNGTFAGLDGTNDVLKVQLVKDAAGNMIEDVVVQKDISGTTSLAPQFVRATAIATNKIVVEYDRPLAKVEENDFSYNSQAAKNAILQNTKVKNADGVEVDGAKITLTFDAGVVDTAVSKSLVTQAANDINTVDAYNNKIAAGATYNGDDLIDGVAPTYTSDDVKVEDVSTISITFSENLASGYAALYKNDFTVSNGGASVAVKSSSVEDEVLTLKLDGKLDPKHSTVVKVKSSGLTVQDDAGNVLVPTQENLDGVTIDGDTTAPAKPEVNAVDSDDVKVTGKAEAGATISVKVGGKEIATGVADENGEFEVEIEVQAKDTVLSVTATDKAGNVSEAATVTVTEATVPNTPPTIELAKDIAEDTPVSVGGTVNAPAKSDVVVKDKEDDAAGTELNVKIEITKGDTKVNEIDTSEAAVYTVTYTVTDSEGAEDKVSRTITIS
ncbi:Ig-like domain-containing protein [Brevibacillus borstelensis]|uniref:Ig-like domain-containing protein n=1 Tax=Brevibacillus borstelensis TaxID=45462 RepID=UPI0030F72590